MDADKYTRSLTLACPTCGCTTLEEVEGEEAEQTTIRCPSCSRTMSKGELIRENGATIDAAVDEMKVGVMDDVRKEVHDMLKDAFKGSKNIRIT